WSGASPAKRACPGAMPPRAARLPARRTIRCSAAACRRPHTASSSRARRSGFSTKALRGTWRIRRSSPFTAAAARTGVGVFRTPAIAATGSRFATTWSATASRPGRRLQLTAGPVRFPHQCAVAAVSLYAHQRRVFDRLARGECDGLAVEEHASALLRDALAAAFGRNSREALTSQDAVQHAREIIARDPGASVRLTELAHRAGLSPFQLCRAFVRVCGETMTAYRLRLRLLTSLEPLSAGGGAPSLPPPPPRGRHP